MICCSNSSKPRVWTQAPLPYSIRNKALDLFLLDIVATKVQRPIPETLAPDTMMLLQLKGTMLFLLQPNISTPARYSSPRPQPDGDSKNHFISSSRPPCQICGKTSHQALDCFHRMDYAFQGRRPPSQLQAMVAHSAYGDQEWYADSAANAHITHDLDNLTLQQPLQTSDVVVVGNGSTLAIANYGSTTLHSPLAEFHLQSVLHCLKAAANLISIQKFYNDND
jgi:hypothetical protein